MTLAELHGGDRFRITKIAIGGEIGKRIVDMGLNRNVEGVMLRCALLGDPLHVRVLNYDVTLRRAEAGGIEVEYIGHDDTRPRHGKGFGKGRNRKRRCQNRRCETPGQGEEPHA